jgi:hypothetical protein
VTADFIAVLVQLPYVLILLVFANRYLEVDPVCETAGAGC